MSRGCLFPVSKREFHIHLCNNNNNVVMSFLIPNQGFFVFKLNQTSNVAFTDHKTRVPQNKRSRVGDENMWVVVCVYLRLCGTLLHPGLSLRCDQCSVPESDEPKDFL